MQLVLVNRETKARKVINDCESIALIDADQETHLPQYYVPNARQQLGAVAFVLTRTRQEPCTFKTSQWEIRND
ncbi:MULTISPECIES: hypothetical protein [Furfurilactobacillus]|uniref:Uncharacterized protein n=1 Tax=Furfurilactobacillus rossiae TaxID=231049 RepID=A0A7C9IZW3_9LACO|nr:hypothetical protein [Furfurilactobacillus milii]MYV06142.1 hypothetical protein [Furfurilactobacillus milii]